MKFLAAVPLVGVLTGLPLAEPSPAIASATQARDRRATRAQPVDEVGLLPEVDVQDLGEGRLFVAASGGYTPEQAMAKAAHDDPTLVEVVEANLRARVAIGTLDPATAAEPEATIDSGDTGSKVRSTKASSVPPMAGYAVGDDRAWFIHRWITGTVCDDKTCTEITRVDLNITTNPGAVTSREQWALLKQGTNVRDCRAGALANFSGNDHGSQYSTYRNSNGSGNLDIANGSSRRGANLRHYVTVQGTLSCAGITGCSHEARVEHRGTTDWALCHTSDNVCVY